MPTRLSRYRQLLVQRPTTVCFRPPVYRPAFQRLQRAVKIMESETAVGLVTLQGCFGTCFMDTCENLNELADVFLSYVILCSSNQINNCFSQQ